MNRVSTVLCLGLVSFVAACTDDLNLELDETSDSDSDTDSESDSDSDSGGLDDGDDTTESADGPSCDYLSPFTQSAECRDYVGTAWTEAEAGADCSSVSGDLDLDAECTGDDSLGRCVFDAGTEWEQQTVIYGSDEGSCDLSATGCEAFGGGTWKPQPICDAGGSGGGGGEAGNVFIQPSLECVDPLPNEGPGQSADGQVCTWQAISGSTEEGRRFLDYGSCETVLTQRPYYPAPPNPTVDEDDPRLGDPLYVTELDWVRSQIEASACVCCHSDATPGGASNWSIDAPNNWINSFDDTGLALGAGWVDSTSFGAFDAADNNGFGRVDSGFPTTDSDRMVAFFQNELLSRGRAEADFEATAPFGGPLYTQMFYEPSACENGEGVQPNGSVVWTGGLARYVYILDSGSGNPTVPPNLDLPMGTRWRVDVPWDTGEPVSSGEVVYGSIPSGTVQTYPADGGPSSLVPGQEYYLYVSKDVGIPITRCLFTY